MSSNDSRPMQILSLFDLCGIVVRKSFPDAYNAYLAKYFPRSMVETMKLIPTYYESDREVSRSITHKSGERKPILLKQIEFHVVIGYSICNKILIDHVVMINRSDNCFLKKREYKYELIDSRDFYIESTFVCQRCKGRPLQKRRRKRGNGMQFLPSAQRPDTCIYCYHSEISTHDPRRPDLISNKPRKKQLGAWLKTARHEAWKKYIWKVVRKFECYTKLNGSWHWRSQVFIKNLHTNKLCGIYT